MSDILLNESWKSVIGIEFEKDYFKELKEFLVNEKSQFRVFPPESRMFAAFNLTPFDEVKVVILGQDPYHGFGQANGLSFSVSDGLRKPPSLLNIFKELQSDLGYPIPESGNLILSAPHPSPLARGGFFGCKHFSKTNEHLVLQGKSPIK